MKLREALELLREMNRECMALFVLMPNGVSGPNGVRKVWEVYDLNGKRMHPCDPCGELIARGPTAKEAILAAYFKVMAANK